MKRRNIALLTIASLILSGLGYWGLNFYECGVSVACYILDIKSQALFYGMLALGVIFALLLVFPQTFNAWKNFALWFLPPAVDAFVTYENLGGGFLDANPSPKEFFTWFGWLYVGLSVTLILGTLIFRKFRKNQTPRQPSKTKKIIFWTVWICYVAVIIGWHFFD